MKGKVVSGIVAFLLSTQLAFAYVVGGINVDGVYAVKGNKDDGNAAGFRTGLSLAYGFEQYYISGRFGFGSDSFADSNADQTETDVELSAGYRLSPALSGFLAFRNRSQDYSRTKGSTLDATETQNHFGAGAALSFPVDNRLIAKADLKAFYLISQYENDFMLNTASGFSGGASVGMIYLIQKGLNMSLTGYVQALNTGYNTGGSYTDFTTGLGLGLVKVF